jgi:hypothetical protein
MFQLLLRTRVHNFSDLTGANSKPARRIAMRKRIEHGSL